ncbi:peptidase domain-containing ABC transporter [Cryobacterium sp. TMT1-2-2]|uniref:peptidase domain-containing ABC transporter n=1 Tax=Cryobacterium sp. TMT1-2-2 TaxID=1259233 RepID=UPI00141B4722|nr:peptidase domain-containing ABC transporter [Cryobacterium sp. TMT1-2-2]
MHKVHIQQHDQSDCAAACLASVAAAHGRRVTITGLRDAMGVGVRGASLRGLLRAAEELGLESTAVRVDREGLLSDYSVPAIAQVTNAAGDSHFVVIHGSRRGKLVIGDPGEERIARVAADDFLDRFTGVLVLFGPASKFVKDRGKPSSNLTRFVRLLTPQRGLFAWALVSSLVLTVLGISGSMVTKVLFDEILPFNLEQLLVPVFIFFLVINLVQHSLFFIRQSIVLHLSQRIDIPLILGYFRHVYSLPISFFASRSVGDVLTRFGDAVTIKNVLTSAALTVVMDVVMAAITGVVLYIMEPDLFIVIALFVLVSTVLVFAFRRPFRKVNQRQMEQVSVLNGRIIEGLRGVEGIKLEANEDREMEGLEREYVRSLRYSFREGMLGNAQSTLTSLIQALVSLILLFYGASRIMGGDLTLGTLTAFVALSAFFIDPVTRLIGLQLQWQEANLALRRVGEIFDLQSESDERPERIRDSPDAGRVSFDNVSFRYSMRELALDEVTFDVERGAKVAFVGPSGGGKSTIAKLILKMHKPERGEIAIGGIDLREIGSQEVRRSVGYVPQSIALYSRTVADNVRMSMPDASDSSVRAALRRASADTFVGQLPHQMETVLEEAGAGLSGGERKRLGLARVLLKEVDVYIFDEVTSDLDALTENVIVDEIFENLRQSTVIFIAHRLATVTECDLIYVLDQGRIVEQGTHDSLLLAGGLYSKMWEAQHVATSNTARGRLPTEDPEHASVALDPPESDRSKQTNVRYLD